MATWGDLEQHTWGELESVNLTWDDLERIDGAELNRLLADATPAGWRGNPLVAYAVFAVVLYINLDVATRAILGPDAWREVQGEVATVLGLLGFLLALDQNNRR